MTPVKQVDRTKILTKTEIKAVLNDLRKKGKRAVNQRCNLTVFRLATCCGLRVSEISGLKMANVILGTDRPHIRIPAAIAKRRKARKVPLWWDAATLADLTNWANERKGQGARADSPFVCAMSIAKLGKQLSIRNLQNRWDHCVKVLGAERVNMLSIHCGRHSFCSHSLEAGRTMLDIRDAAGHADISTTSIYLHSVTKDDGVMGSDFEF